MKQRNSAQLALFALALALASSSIAAAQQPQFDKTEIKQLVRKKDKDKKKNNKKKKKDDAEGVIASPTAPPSGLPTYNPTVWPTWFPTAPDTPEPTEKPTEEPTKTPTEEPTKDPTPEPTPEPTPKPTKRREVEPPPLILNLPPLTAAATVIAVDDSVTLPVGTSEAFIGVLENDVGSNLSITGITSQASDGFCSVSLGLTEVVYAVDDPDFAGIDTCTYEVCDNEDDCDTALVFVTFGNDTPGPTPANNVLTLTPTVDATRDGTMLPTLFSPTLVPTLAPSSNPNTPFPTENSGGLRTSAPTEDFMRDSPTVFPTAVPTYVPTYVPTLATDDTGDDYGYGKDDDEYHHHNHHHHPRDSPHSSSYSGKVGKSGVRHGGKHSKCGKSGGGRCHNGSEKIFSKAWSGRSRSGSYSGSSSSSGSSGSRSNGSTHRSKLPSYSSSSSSDGSTYHSKLTSYDEDAHHDHYHESGHSTSSSLSGDYSGKTGKLGVGAKGRKLMGKNAKRH